MMFNPAARTKPSACSSFLRRALPLALLAASTAAWCDTATDSREYQIKAAFLYNFTRFVDWPDSSFADAGSPIVLGTYCDEPFASMLEQIVKDRTVNGRRIVVSRLETHEGARGAHEVFVCAGRDAQFGSIEEVVRNQPVLTVCETDAARELGAIIEFQREDDRVRFAINIAAADRARLRLRAQLQKLATAVRRSP